MQGLNLRFELPGLHKLHHASPSYPGWVDQMLEILPNLEASLWLVFVFLLQGSVILPWRLPSWCRVRRELRGVLPVQSALLLLPGRILGLAFVVCSQEVRCLLGIRIPLLLFVHFYKNRLEQDLDDHCERYRTLCGRLRRLGRHL